MEVFGGFGGVVAGLMRCGRFASRAQLADVVAHIGRTSAHISVAFQRALGASFSRQGISTSLLRERTEREVAGPIPLDPDWVCPGSPLRAPLREEVCVDFDADVEVGMEEESVPEFREPIAWAKEKVDVAERKVVQQGAEEAAADSGPLPALGILDQPTLAVSLPNPDFDTGAGGDTEGVARSTSAEGLLPLPALPPPPPALRARARGVSMAAEAGHRRDVGVRTRVRFAEGCLQGCRDAGSAGETEAAAVVVLAAVVVGTVVGGRGELARAVTAQPPPAVLAPPVVQGGVVETASEAGGDSAAGGSSADAPTPACGCRRLQPWTRRWCKTGRRWRPVWPTTTAQQEAFLQTPPPLLRSRRPIKAGSWTARPEWWRQTPSWTRCWPRRAERARPWRRTEPASSQRWRRRCPAGRQRRCARQRSTCSCKMMCWLGSLRWRVARSTSLGCGDLMGGATRCHWKRSAGPRACRSGSSRCRRRVCPGCSGWARRGGSWPS